MTSLGTPVPTCPALNSAKDSTQEVLIVSHKMSTVTDENWLHHQDSSLLKLEMEHTEKSKAHVGEGLLQKIRLYLSEKSLPSPSDREKLDHDFATSTSFHGVHNVVRNRSRIRKVVWLAVVLGSVLLLVWQIYGRLIHYFTWPTTTSVEVQYVENIEFPAVTFCNLNRFQTEAATKFGIIFFLWHIVSKVLHLQEISTNSTGSKEAIDFLASHQNFSITEFVKKKGFYLNRSTLLECDFFGKPCGPEEEFTDDPTLGFVDAGIVFAIHSPVKVPQLDGLGLLSPVGTHARVTIRQVKNASPSIISLTFILNVGFTVSLGWTAGSQGVHEPVPAEAGLPPQIVSSVLCCPLEAPRATHRGSKETSKGKQLIVKQHRSL
ncbi:amiloride-sensitive cation channel 5 [Camelus ferus]|nr:amiloride-sensitive cation channel 5 [Camelus ferus]